MNISVFGLGYVGTVTAACLANENNEVIGVDIKEDKVSAINHGVAPQYEKGLNDLISKAVAKGKLRATTDVRVAIDNSEITLICVGTPANLDGSLNLDHMRRVCEQIGMIIRDKTKYHVIVVRSTILPGTTHNVIIPTLEGMSAKKCGMDFGVCVNPEFLREGQAVYDFFNPERIVIGESDKRAGNSLEQIYSNIDVPLVRMDITTAEIIKYVDNTFHAFKITFTNEIGSICKKLGIDSRKVMDIFCMDKKLNLAPYYFKPGFAFGGSCLPKDLSALLAKSAELNLQLPLLESIRRSNYAHIERAVDLIIGLNKKSVGVLGLTFKSGTADTRESPAIILIHRLYERGYGKLFDKGYDITVFDPALKKPDIDALPPHIKSIATFSLVDLVKSSSVLVITKDDEEFTRLPDLISDNQIIVDLVGTIKRDTIKSGQYIGLCW
jgi:GDP-mannose 6-dehydrogenase